jgi:hypothetical protein
VARPGGVNIWHTSIPVMALLFALGVNSQAPRPRAAHALFTRRPAPPTHAGYPPYDMVYGSATHNSYWVPRDRLGEKLAHGTQERLLDQLLHDRARALELDIHFNAKQPGVFSVYHTDALGNSLCSPLDECLKQLALFQYLEPHHDVVNVIIELKELWAHLFAPGHSITELDATLHKYLGDALYTPRDFLARCPPGMTLRECARTHGWPGIDELRGKLIINLLGNFNYNANDWVDYATRNGGVINRVAFPMRSILRDNGEGLTGIVDEGVHDAFDPAAVQAARAASIFWQVERLDYPELDDFLAQHGVIRARSAQTRPEQLERIRRGFQLIQNDHPWHVVEVERPILATVTTALSSLPIDPSRRLRDPGAVDGKPWWPAKVLIEPGARLYAVSDDDTRLFFASTDVDGDARWETAPSTTRTGGNPRLRLSLWPPRLSYDRFAALVRPRGLGCLRAQSSDGDEWFMICRQVIDGELARVSLHWRRAGEPSETVRAFDSGTQRAGRVGDLVAMRIASEDGRVCAHGASASQMAGAAPAWNELGSICFTSALPLQGVAAIGDVLFVGTRHDHALVAGATLPTRAGGTLLDLSRTD